MKATRGLAVGAGLAAGAYLAHVAATWSRYGRAPRAAADEGDGLLDRFMPAYDVADRHRIRVAAPAGMVLETARSLDLFGTALVRAIFDARELLLGATGGDRRLTGGLLTEVQALGWVI